MTHNATAPVDAEQSKLAAHAIKKRFDELNSPIKLNHAYEALAIAHRYPNWATMKAALSATTPHAAAATPAFVFGRGKGDVHMAIEPHKALAHIHAFSTSHVARRELLMRLSRNAVENSSALVFIEPVSMEDLRSGTMKTVMDMASDAKRSRDVFVLDLSHAQTRLGNRFNVLADADDPAEIAALFMAARSNFSSTFYLEYSKIIEVAAGTAINRLDRQSGAVLTASMVRDEIAKLASGDVPLPEDEMWNPARVGRRIADLAKVSDSIVWQAMTRHARCFDAESVWRGPGRAIVDRNILLVFLAREPDDFESVLEKIVVKTIKKAVSAASLDTRRFPDMVVCSDVDGFSSPALAHDARAHGVCLVLGDQCQTLPSSLSKASTRFRSDYGEHGHWHYLLDEDGDRSAPLTVWR
ncbi:hypothetical protein O9X98_15495 [Agrobacterium salinitolerans]|nr:hypothetical protein [Agrobacterium salinitolerans]